MSRHRDRYDISLEILQYIRENEPVKPTRLTHHVNLSWRTKNAYISTLINFGLVEKTAPGENKNCKHTYSLTSEGHNLMKSPDRFRTLYTLFNKEEKICLN